MPKHTVLIIDDHPLIAEVYETALLNVTKNDSEQQFSISTVNNCDSAIEIIKSDNVIDLVFLDISLPKSSDGKYLSGEDIGVELRHLRPETKIIVSTTHNDNYRVYTILKSINPEAFLVKNEFKRKDLVEAIESVLQNKPAYSKTVLNLLRNQLTHDHLIDKIDRDILYQISIGTPTNELENTISLSQGGIASRKRKLKEIFNIVNGNDKQLIQIAKDKGFI